jgi:hypothetical protein
MTANLKPQKTDEDPVYCRKLCKTKQDGWIEVSLQAGRPGNIETMVSGLI